MDRRLFPPRARCWDCHWQKHIEDLALMSTCCTRHVGGVLVRGNRVVADGFNGSLPGLLHCDLGGCVRCNDPAVLSGQDLERCSCVHCEQNIIAYCARFGIPTDNTTLYLPTTPCLDCFKLVVSAGVTEIVYDTSYPKFEEHILSLLKELKQIVLRRFSCHCT